MLEIISVFLVSYCLLFSITYPFHAHKRFKAFEEEIEALKGKK